ncbi:MAG TPA: pilus assembly protein PilM [Candidatus Paceibacterota bacterium]
MSLISKIFPTPVYLQLPLAGLDISDRAIKYVELVTHHGKLRLAKFEETEIEEGIIKGGVVLNKDKFISILRKMCGKIGQTLFHISLPEEKAYLVEMQLPTSARSDLRGAIELHLEEHVPLETAGVTFDFQIVHKPKDSPKGEYTVAVSVIETNFVESYFEVLSEAGLSPIGFEFESQALARVVVDRKINGITMVVDIGREQSHVSIVSQGIVRSTSSLSVGGNAFVRAIMEDLKVDGLEALRLKETEGLFRRGKDKSPFGSIIRVASVLRDEMWERLIYWNTGRERSNAKDVINQVVLCGGNANVPGLLEYLTSGIDVNVSVANPWVNILSLDDNVPDLIARESLKYCTALGLALRSRET